MSACERPHMKFLDDEFGRRTVNRHSYLPEPSRPGSELEALRRARVVAQDMVKENNSTGSSNSNQLGTDGKLKPAATTVTFDDGDEIEEEVFDIYSTMDWPIVGHGDSFKRNGMLVVEVHWKPLLIPETALKFYAQAERHFVELEQGRRFWCESWTQSQSEKSRGVLKVVWLSTIEPWSNINQPEDTIASIETGDGVSCTSDDDSDCDEHGYISRNRNATSCRVQGSRDNTGETEANRDPRQRSRIYRRRNSLDDTLRIIPTEGRQDYDLVALIESTQDRLHKEISQGIRPKQQQSLRDLSTVLKLPRVRRVLFSAYAVSRRIRWNGRRNSKALATAVQAVGVIRDPCERCQKTGDGGPPFEGCVTLELDGRPILNGSCACCYYHEKNKCRYRIAPETCSDRQERAKTTNGEIEASTRGAAGIDVNRTRHPRSTSEGYSGDHRAVPTLQRLPASEPQADCDHALAKRKAVAIDDGSQADERAHIRRRLSPCQRPVEEDDRRISAEVNTMTGMVSPPPSSPAQQAMMEPVSKVDVIEKEQTPGVSNGNPRRIKVEQYETPPNSQQEHIHLGVFDFGPGKMAIVFKDDHASNLSEAQVRWLFRQCTREDVEVVQELRDSYVEFEGLNIAQGVPSSPYQFLQEDEYGRRKVRLLIRTLCPQRSHIVDLDSGTDSDEGVNVKLDTSEED